VGRDFLSSAVENIPSSGIRKFFDLVLEAGDKVISLGVGEPDFSAPWHVREATIFSLEKGFTSYSENAGLFELRQEISAYTAEYSRKNPGNGSLHSTHSQNTGNQKFVYDPKTEIVVTNGVSEGMDIAFRATINPGEKVLLPNPGFVMYEPLVRLAGGTPVFYDPLHIQEVKIPENTKGIVLNFPGNPIGNTFSRKDLEYIAQLAREHDVLIYSDEIYEKLSFEEKHTSIIELEGMKDRTLLFNGLSKSHAMTGFRIGWICGPSNIIAAMTKIHQYAAMCVSTPSQVAAVEALRRGEKEVQKMYEEYAQRRDFCIERLTQIGLNFEMPKGAFYIFVKIPEKFNNDDVEFAQQLLLQNDLAVVPGSAFGSAGKGFVRITYASSKAELTEAFNRLEKFLGNL
jgi:aminotransferase